MEANTQLLLVNLSGKSLNRDDIVHSTFCRVGSLRNVSHILAISMGKRFPYQLGVHDGNGKRQPTLPISKVFCGLRK